MYNITLINLTTAVEVNDDFTMLWILLSGILVFFMQAGFTLVESGFTRSKNAVNISMKNILDISVGTISYWAIGYGLMYGSSNGWIATSDIFFNPGDGPHDVFFQTVFCATAATIVSGAIAGRTKYTTYVLFTIFLTALIYPISGGWQWNGDGWLANLGFIDFAGSSIVHSVGGWAALVGAWMVGPRLGKYVDGKSNVIPGHNLLLGALGVFILWLGWFGFNGGSQLAWGGDDSVAASAVVMVTNIAAAAGAVGAMATTWIKDGKPNLGMTLNGAIAGLVAITAEPLAPTPGAAIVIGAIGGAIVVLGTKLLFKAKIDDVVGAIPVHMFAGIWGTLAVPLSNADANFGAQFLGVISVIAFVFVVSFVIWKVMASTFGIRVSKEAETKGTDVAEIGVIAYSISL